MRFRQNETHIGLLKTMVIDAAVVVRGFEVQQLLIEMIGKGVAPLTGTLWSRSTFADKPNWMESHPYYGVSGVPTFSGRMEWKADIN